MALQRTRHVSVGIARPLGDVYAFLSEPANFPKWASGLGHSFEPLAGSEWMAETPMGSMKVQFSERNPYGILDHTLLPERAAPMHNPMRAMANGDGCEVVFTLFQRPVMSDAEFARDADWVERDLAALKALLEG